MKILAQTVLFKLLRFLDPPAVTFDEARSKAFAHLYETAVAPGAGDFIDYQLPYPRHEFLRFLVDRHPVLLHGSGHSTITTLEPRRQTLFDGRTVDAVFATSDGLWPCFYATMPRPQGVPRSIRNGGLAVQGPKGKRTFYFFSLSDTMADCPWQSGAVYILPRAPFSLQSPTWQEWTSPEPVRPLAKLAIAPDDFPLRHAVGRHGLKESSALFWLRRIVGARGVNGPA
ncbi:MAG TPA: hypothetical protein VK464_02155 [Symbiobacteriaceae bacterium]|nr:hypothetical protein [Symbiobacteriaceae bacterium]